MLIGLLYTNVAIIVSSSSNTVSERNILRNKGIALTTQAEDKGKRSASDASRLTR